MAEAIGLDSPYSEYVAGSPASDLRLLWSLAMVRDYLADLQLLLCSLSLNILSSLTVVELLSII